MFDLWKITKCSAVDADLSGLSLQRNESRRIIVQVVELNRPSRSSTMARRVFRTTGHLIGTIGLWLMVFCIFLVLAPAIGVIVLGLTMWWLLERMSVVTTKLKRTLKG